jgi:hypothetical protein
MTWRGSAGVAKCKNCQRKGFMVETDVNGLCSACAPYYYLTMPDDLKALNHALQALNRTSKAESAVNRLEIAAACLERLRSYAKAGLVRLPEPLEQLERRLAALREQLESD